MKLHATGIRQIDWYSMSGRVPSVYWPAVLGHEGGGEVVELGKGVTSLEVGDHVVPLFISECGKCPECRSPVTNLWRTAPDDTMTRD